MDAPALGAVLALAGLVADVLRGAQGQLQDIAGHGEAADLSLGGPPALVVGETLLLCMSC